MVGLSTFLQSYDRRIRAFRTIPDVLYSNIQEKAGNHELLHKDDFYFSPEGFQLDLPDNWESIDNDRILAGFDFPMQVKFLQGIRFRKCEGLLPIKHAGQFQIVKPSQIPHPKIEVWVGSSSRPIASIEKSDKKFNYSNIKEGEQVLFSLADVLEKVIKLAKIHKGEQPFWDNREAYIRQVLPDFFKQ